MQHLRDAAYAATHTNGKKNGNAGKKKDGPITTGYLVRDLAIDLELPVVVAARTGLGTINHTLLTVEAARAAGLRVAGVVMTPWPDDPARIERSNRETVERLSGLPVSGLPRTDPDGLAEAGASLPLDDWL